MRCVFIVAVLLATSAQAQNISVDAREERKSATEEEAAFRGRGDYLRDAGRYLESRSEAYLRHQEAESKRLDNLLAWERATAKARYNDAIDKMERQLRRYPPRRITAAGLSSAGDIRWPAVLLRPEFADHRQGVEDLFARRSSPVSSSSICYDVAEACTAFDMALRQQVTDIPKPTYLEGARFLRNLAYEATFPTATAERLADK